MASNTKVHYKSLANPINGNINLLEPAPQISLSAEIYYANDSVIGYTYQITLNGFANALRPSQRPSNAPSTGIDGVISHIDHIRSIFSCNGGDLQVLQDNTLTLNAKGCTIKSISFEESNNYWTYYAPFTVVLECNEIDFIGCQNNELINCSDSFFHVLNTFNTDNLPSDHLVDIKKYKIKEFSDNWTFSLDDQVYKEVSFIDNNHFNVSYDISAVGKHYYIDNKLIPAWEMAKKFCQDRLYDQIKSLLDNTNTKRALPIKDNNFDGNTATLKPNELFDTTNVNSKGLFEDDLSTQYKLYNETINCGPSESAGSFSIKYSAIVKKCDNSKTASENAALHEFTANETYSDGENLSLTLSVNGTVRGLVEGGFIYKYNDDFELPASGNFIIKKDNNITKHDNAYDAFLSYIKHSSRDDLSDYVKTQLDITNTRLMIQPHPVLSSTPLPISFLTTHDYHEGTIGYTANYDNISSIDNELGYTNISIVKNYATPVAQEFIVPGRAGGPIIQLLNTKKNSTISISVDGLSDANRQCGVASIDICNSTPDLNSIPGLSSLASITKHPNYIKTKENYNVNRIDGSFHLELEYICLGE